MKNSKIFTIFGVLLILVIIGGFFGIRYAKQKAENNVGEYTPAEEISDEQARKTLVSLYFVDKETGSLYPEARLVDVRDLINLPYEKLINLLIEGPKNEKLKKIIPDNTTILKTYMQDDCLVIDFSSDFLCFNKDEDGIKDNMIKSIVYTMTELTEINKVKFLIEGNENEEFKGEFVR